MRRGHSEREQRGGEKLTTLSAMVSPRADKEAVEIFSQAFELQGQFLDVRVPFLSIDEKRPVELVQGVVDLILLFESGKLVRFVILGMYSKSKGNS